MLRLAILDDYAGAALDSAEMLATQGDRLFFLGQPPVDVR